MARALLSNFIIKDSPEFNINKVEAIIQNDKEKPEFHNYADFLNYRFAGILRASSYLHENSDIFPIKSHLKTYCNLIISLAMSEIVPSIRWTDKEITEILRMGYDLMLRIPSNENHSWILKHVQIGRNQFKIEDNVEQCVFLIDEGIAEEEIAENVTELNPFRSEIDESDQGPVSQNPEDSEEPETLQAESSKDLTPKVTIETQINSLYSKDVAWIVIESDLFWLACWKQDGLYYLFDPKETLVDGKFPTKRLEFVQKSVEEARLKEQMQHIRKTQVETNEKLEIEIVDEELKKYAVPEAYLSIMHLPKSGHRLPMRNVKEEEGKIGYRYNLYT